MYKLLVVDDEIWIRQRIAKTLPWEQISITQVETAEDGQEALEKIKSFCPDIMIMDIRMPLLDGVELMHILQKEPNAPKVIILSGYDEFDYAKEALKFGAFDYLLKPIEDEMLLEVVKKCIIDIALERERKKEISQLYVAVERSYDALKERMLRKIISGEYQEGEAIREKNTVYGVDVLFAENIKADKHLCLLLHIDNIVQMEEGRDVVLFILRNIMTEILSVYGVCNNILLMESNDILFVLSLMDSKGENVRRKLHMDIEMVRNMLREKMKIVISVGMGLLCDDFWDLPYAYDTVRIVMKYKKWEEGGSEEKIRQLIDSVGTAGRETTGKGKKLVQKAVNYIVEHYQKPISLNDVADYLELNNSYFCRIFKEEMGMSFVSFLQDYRIEKAVEFMKDKNYKIYEIGNMVGYENQQYFNKVFKKLKGISPVAYRETL